MLLCQTLFEMYGQLMWTHTYGRAPMNWNIGRHCLGYLQNHLSNPCICRFLFLKGRCGSSEHNNNMKLSTWNCYHITGIPIWQHTTDFSFVPIKGADIWTFQLSKNAPPHTSSFREMDNWNVTCEVANCSWHSVECSKV